MDNQGYVVPPMDRLTKTKRSGDRTQDAIVSLTRRGITGDSIRKAIQAGTNPFTNGKPQALWLISELLRITILRSQTLSKPTLIKLMAKHCSSERAAQTAVSFALKLLLELEVIHTTQDGRILLK